MRKTRIGLGVLLALLVVFSGQAAVSAQTTGTPTTVSGTFTLIYGDSQGASDHRNVFNVTDDAGQTHRLTITEAVGAAAGGVTNLTGKRVTVTGSALGAPPGGGPGVIAASSITVDAAAAGPAAAPEALTGGQKFATILCRFSDSTGTTPKTPAYVQGLLGDAYPGISHFWKENSYNLINNTGSAVKGWYNLPQPRSYYIPGGSLDFFRAARDCTALADSTTDFNQYVGINLLFNQNLDGYAWGGAQTLTLDGTNKAWPMTWMPPWGYADQSVLGHEMGHAYGLPHSSGNYGNVYDSRWDVMSWGGRAIGTPDATYGRLGTHTISYHKDKLNWIPAGRKYTAAANSCTELYLDHLEQVPATVGNYLMAKIPVSATRFYTVEARKAKGYDGAGRLPGEAVLIHDVVTTRSEPAHVMDNTNDGNTNDQGAMWLPGETFTDGANAVKIEVLSATANGWVVRVTKGTGVCATGPPAPVLVSPATTGITNTVTYRWNSASTATWYRIYVSGPGGVREAWVTAASAGCSGGGVCTWAPTGSAEAGVPWSLGNGNYTWWARGWVGGISGPWSTSRAFTVGPPVAPTLVSPSAVSATNPVVYRWNSVPNATWYRLYVSGPGGNRAQWFTAASAGCAGGGTCQLTPTGNAESAIPWQLSAGSHTWWVAGWNSAGQGPWSVSKSFTGVFGFDSQFNANSAGWVARQGAWSVVSGAFLTSTGIADANSSVYYGGSTFPNFTYEARLWRNGSNLANKLFVRGNPTTLNGTGNWSNTYQFNYSRDGQFGVWKTVNGNEVTLQNWTTTSAINQGSTWNTLRVTVSGTSLQFAINGTVVWSGTDATFSAGHVGVDFYRDAATGNQLWVDYARLTAPLFLVATVSADQQAANNAAVSGGSSNGPPATAQSASASSADQPASAQAVPEGSATGGGGEAVASAGQPSASPSAGPPGAGATSPN